jgi:hypothetical protein
VEVLAVEEIIGGRDVGVAGTIDRLVRLGGSTYILDLKSGDPASWHRLQLAGYIYASKAQHGRLCVYLNALGMYRVKEFGDPEDESVFLSALRMVRGWEAA